jgi:ATP-dependent DNA helicase RecG
MPSPTEKLYKFFKLEADRGYDNRAVVGGLEKISPIWESEARQQNLDEQLIQNVSRKLVEYHELEQAARAGVIKDLVELLQTVTPTTLQNIPAQPERPVRIPRETSQTEMRGRPETTRHPRQSRSQGSARPESGESLGLNAPLTVLQGIGPKTAHTLANLGLNTLGDLLYYFPRRYDDYSKFLPINRLKYGEEVTVIGAIQSISTRPVKNGQMQITEAVLSDGSGFIRLTWFNQPWLNSRLTSGTQVVVSGKTRMYLGRMIMDNPDWEFLEEEHLHTNRIVPVYPLTSHVNQKWLRRTMYQTITFWASRMPDFLPRSVKTSAGLLDLSRALQQVHFPDSDEMLNAAQSRLAFDEIFLMQLGVLRQKRNWQEATAQIFISPEDWMEAQKARLPFTLTNAQQNAVRDVLADLASGRPMNRLLQGDVGSGKTVVAALAIAVVARQACQSAFMAPTSILAEQHYRSLLRLLASEEENGESLLKPEEIRLMVGDTAEAEKKQIREGLADGSIKLVIGTHALLEDPVTFQNLELTIIDEQHRFGVAQRSALRSKGTNPHLLVMTATPIPRSLALTVYGDLDLSVMDEMPAGRQPIETYVLRPVERERAYEVIHSQLLEGHQAFIIYPLVELGERDEGKAAVEEQARLQKEVFAHQKVGLLHGRMKPEEKDDVMLRFRNKEYQVLVSTSVIEVGVDIPNATVMLIEGANRFGLAQLHQFRGRVGRSEHQSYCLLIPETEDAVENERLAAMAETNDGFVLAERDLQQRGPGDFLGTRQSGFAELKMAKLTDVRLIEKARTQAQALFEIDPDLSQPEHEALDKMFRRFWGYGRGDVS